MIATVIPVLLLAGLLDVEGLQHLLTAERESGGRAARIRRYVTLIIAYASIVFAVIRIAYGFIIACQGAALGITLRGGDASSVWVSLSLTLLYVILMTITRVVFRSLESRLAEARWKLGDARTEALVRRDRMQAEIDVLRWEEERVRADAAFRMSKLGAEADSEILKQLAELNRQLSALREGLGGAEERPLPPHRRRPFAWLRRNTRPGGV